MKYNCPNCGMEHKVLRRHRFNTINCQYCKEPFVLATEEEMRNKKQKERSKMESNAVRFLDNHGYCNNCETEIGGYQRRRPGSLAVEICLLFFGLVLIPFGIGFFLLLALVFYSLWRVAAKKVCACPNCGSHDTMPFTAPKARKLIKENSIEIPEEYRGLVC